MAGLDPAIQSGADLTSVDAGWPARWPAMTTEKVSRLERLWEVILVLSLIKLLAGIP